MAQNKIPTSGWSNDTGRLNSARKGTLQNSVMSASAFSYCTSVISGTTSSMDGTPGFRLMSEESNKRLNARQSMSRTRENATQLHSEAL